MRQHLRMVEELSKDYSVKMMELAIVLSFSSGLDTLFLSGTGTLIINCSFAI